MLRFLATTSGSRLAKRTNSNVRTGDPFIYAAVRTFREFRHAGSERDALPQAQRSSLQSLLTSAMRELVKGMRSGCGGLALVEEILASVKTFSDRCRFFGFGSRRKSHADQLADAVLFHGHPVEHVGAISVRLL